MAGRIEKATEGLSRESTLNVQGHYTTHAHLASQLKCMERIEQHTKTLTVCVIILTVIALASLICSGFAYMALDTLSP